MFPSSSSSSKYSNFQFNSIGIKPSKSLGFDSIVLFFMDSSHCKNPPFMSSNDLTRALANSFSIIFFLILAFLAFKSMVQWILQGSSTQTELPVQQQQQQQQQHQTCSSSPEEAAVAAATALLAAISVLIYEPESINSSLECENCSICLDAFEHGDTIKVLPRCKHMFHKDCIDEWLPSRSIFCPVCRDRIIGPDEGENLYQNDEGGRTNSCNRNSGSSSLVTPPAPPVIINVVSLSISSNPL